MRFLYAILFLSLDELIAGKSERVLAPMSNEIEDIFAKVLMSLHYFCSVLKFPL